MLYTEYLHSLPRTDMVGIWFTHRIQPVLLGWVPECCLAHMISLLYALPSPWKCSSCSFGQNQHVWAPVVVVHPETFIWPNYHTPFTFPGMRPQEHFGCVMFWHVLGERLVVWGNPRRTSSHEGCHSVKWNVNALFKLRSEWNFTTRVTSSNNIFIIRNERTKIRHIYNK